MARYGRVQLICNKGTKYPFVRRRTEGNNVRYDPVVPVKIRSDIEGKFSERPEDFIIDSGSDITIISWSLAIRFGLDLFGNTWLPIQISGIRSRIPVLRRFVQLRIGEFPSIAIPIHVSHEVSENCRILGLEGLLEIYSFIFHNYHTYIFLKEEVIDQ